MSCLFKLKYFAFSLSRCVAIHGSHNVDVVNNFAYDHYGHCFFLEDGGEKHNLFQGNLGIGTRKGNLNPSDQQPTTFWITSPLTKMIDNVAGGSDFHTGVGIWYIFPDRVLDPSAQFGLMAPKEAKHTPILEFRNNVAHSNGKAGLAFFRRLGANHEIIGCSTYTPKVQPRKRASDLMPIVLNGGGHTDTHGSGM